MTNKILIITLGLFTIVGSLYFAKPTQAQNPVTTLIDRIAEKFNLNQNEVQKVADDFRSEKMKTMQTERRARLEERLTQAVSNGKITQTQKNSILKKMDELQKKREEDRTDMLNWAKQNGLEGKGFGMGMGKFGRGMHFRK